VRFIPRNRHQQEVIEYLVEADRVHKEHFRMVNEKGDVTSAVANGSGVYSGGEWDTYPPVLRRLRFTPGRIRGRAVECRVLASIRHTFVERVIQ
jgi:hypothetical protein